MIRWPFFTTNASRRNNLTDRRLSAPECVGWAPPTESCLVGGAHPDMVGPVKPPPSAFFRGLGVGTVFDRPRPKTVLRCGVARCIIRCYCLVMIMSTSRFLLGKGQGDRSRWASLRRLISLIFAGWLPHEVDPTGASSLYEQASVASMRPAQGWAEDSPYRTANATSPFGSLLSISIMIVNSIKHSLTLISL